MYTVNIGRVVISIRERDALRADFFVYRYRKGTEESSQMREEIYQIRHPEHILFTARYHIEVDGRELDILTGADGWWGSFTAWMGTGRFPMRQSSVSMCQMSQIFHG